MDIVERFAAIVAKKVAAQLKNGHPQAGKKLDMKCRVPHCRNRSRGPRFLYMCPKHEIALSFAQQRAALVAYNARKKHNGG